MNMYIEDNQSLFDGVINHFKDELKQIRSGQANPDLLDGISVEAYGTHTPLKQLATITVPEPKQLLIQPFDKSITKDIEQAIVASNIGFSPVNEGDQLRIVMPPMTEENRKDLAKIVHQKAEKARVSLRQGRDKVKELIQNAESEKDITEDDKFRFLKELDEYTSAKTKEATELADAKEKQIMTV